MADAIRWADEMRPAPDDPEDMVLRLFRACFHARPAPDTPARIDHRMQGGGLMHSRCARCLLGFETPALQAPPPKYEPRENEKRWQPVEKVDQKIHRQ